MSERTIQHMARELAGAYYDMVRSAEDADEKVQISKRGRIYLQIDPKGFAKTYPTVRDYLAGRQHGRMEHLIDGTVRHIADGSITQTTPGWRHFYAKARAQLTSMLMMPNVHDNLKEGIYKALIEDREKQLKAEMRGQVHHTTQVQ